VSDTLNRDRLLAMLNAEITAIGATAEVRLFTNDIELADDLVIGDFVEPTGAWYDPATDGVAVYGEPFLDPDTGELCAAVTPIQYNWASGGGAGPETIRGWFISNAGGTVWYHAGKLPVARELATALDSVIVAPLVRLPAVVGS